MVMKEKTPLELQLGKISPHVTIDDRTIREMVEQDENRSVVAQGHITNCSARPVDDVRVDVSYYSFDSAFLGLDRSGLLDEDEIEPERTISFSIDLDIPNGTVKCILNVSAKKMATGILMKWLVGGK